MSKLEERDTGEKKGGGNDESEGTSQRRRSQLKNLYAWGHSKFIVWPCQKKSIIGLHGRFVVGGTRDGPST